MEDRTTCEFYEVDQDALKEAEEIEAAGRECFGSAVWDAMQTEADAMAAALGPEPDPCANCWGCKYFCSGAGFPGEYVYHCSRPGHEHIIDVDFNLAEII